ncbi:MAG: hypothetical protein M1818_008426 [Claussenomyces sp. TS43310]|nr:MAG: hypothetical protein M1818_008426 [Claussenomyces sp. TS43310]
MSSTAISPLPLIQATVPVREDKQPAGADKVLYGVRLLVGKVLSADSCQCLGLVVWASEAVRGQKNEEKKQREAERQANELVIRSSNEEERQASGAAQI